MTSHFTLESNVRISSFAKMSDMVKSPEVYHDLEFMENNKHIADEWRRIADLYPEGSSQPLLPETFSRDQFGQGNHYECFMLSALSTLIRFPDVIRHCFVTTEVQPDGHYTFQFFRDKEWVKVEIDDYIAMDGDEVLYIRSPDESWWPLLLEKAYAKFYTAYDHLEGCTLQEAYHDLTGNPVLTIPMQPKLAKSAGVEVAKGSYWLSLAQRIQSGHFAASVLTRDLDVESIGLQREQQYGVLDIFSMTGTSHVEDIVIQLHNPFEDEEYTYTGPLNSRDTAWTDKLRAKYHVNEDERSIFIPLATFLKIMNSFQLCYISPIDPNSITYFHDEWKGLTAGGNPTMVTWRNNPLYLVRNVADTMATVVVSIKNEDQRQSTPTDERSAYVQCGVLLVQYAYPDPIPTYWVTGNNHKSIFRSLFLNSREVSNTITIPPRSTCYLVPSCLQRGVEDTFTMAIHKMKDTDYSGLTVQKLSLPDKDFEHPTTASIELRQKEKGRVDFYVDEPTDVHILLHQTKPYVSKSGGDAMTEDYVGMYLYDDTDHKIGGVHAATNYREISVIHRLPRSGRYAVSVTCPRAKDDEVVPLVVSFVGKREAHVRIVDAPDDATIFDDEEDFIDDGGKKEETNPVDASSIILHSDDIVECPDSNTPFEDRRFMSLNRVVTSDPWVHIGDLYPVGKTLPLLPEVLSREQFQRGTSQECACLTAFAVLVEHHPDVIRHCFVSQQPRKDGRYVFRFHRYGRWVSVEIDDRIPQTGGRTVFCESPTEHWWPLLLEKAYAKFYSMYHNLEGCTMDEIFHDFTGRPVVCASSEAQLSAVAFWMNLKTLASEKHSIVLAANSKKEMEEPMGLLTGTSFGILDILPTKGSDSTLEDVLIAMYNPFGSACTYSGPMDPSDSRWTDELRAAHKPGSEGVMLIPASIFASLFDGVQQAYIGSTALVDPSLHFNSEWAVGTTGGNPEMLAWRENPLYVVRNTSDKAIDVVAMIGQVDQRHALHRQTQAELNYIQCGLVLAQLSDPHAQQIPTYLVTRNTHELIAQQEPFLRTREASTFFSIPPQSLCYLVPSGAIREKGTFMLSYWLLDRSEEAEKHLSIERLAITVAHNFPAIGQVELANHGRGRVDFVLDAASDVHVLLTQVKAFKGSNGVNSLAEDVVEMSLYNSVGELIYHAPAGGRREVGMVCHVDHAGRYSVLVRCVEGHGQVPCKVEVVATKEANARIADIPDGAHELGEADLSFLDPAPEGVPLADLPLDRDEVFLNRVDVLKRLHPDVNSPEEYECAREPIKERVEELALEEIAKDRPEYLAGRDLEALNPLLDADADYMAAEKARYPLMKEAVAEPTPEHQSALEAAEEDLRRRADNLKEADDRRDFESLLEPEYEGIPLADIDPSRDPIYQELVQQRAALLTDYASNASKITAFEEALHERIRVLAEEMHAQERNFYDREPEGVPLELVPLNTDVEVSTKEDELRALRRGDVSVSQPQVTEIEQQLNRRSHELAANLKQEERKMFLDQEPLGISVTSLPVDEDEEFHAKEVQRLRLRHASLTETEPEIQQLEKEMNERAKVLAQERRDNLWSFLDQEPYGIPIDKLGLEYAQEFMAMESRLRELTDDSAADPAAVAAVQKEMADFVEAVASAQAAQDREFLDPTPEGRQLDTLNITSVPEFLAMDKDRRRIKFAVAEKEDGGDHAEEIEKMCALEKDMNALAHDLARQKNVEERPAFMLPEYKSISRSHLPLDEDPAFADMESQRQVLKWEPDRNSRAISEVEADLNNRANELAMQQLHESRGYLNPSPDGVPLHVLPLDTDETFCEGEQHRHQLLAATPVDEEAVAAQEASLNARAVEMAKAMRAEERPKFLAATYNEIPTEQLPLDSDEAFLQQEADRLVLQKNGEDTAVVESALTQRAQELADAQIEQGRAFLDPLPGGVPIAVVHPERDATFTAQEAERREALRKDPVDPAAVEELEKHMNARVLELSEALRQRAREEVLPAAPGGIPRSALQLDEDATYLEREAAYLQATNGLEPGHPAAEAEATSMQERAVEMATSLRDAERAALHIPLGYTLGDIPFDESADYVAEEAKLCEQRHLNSRDEAPASAVEELEQRLQAITRELAWAKAYGELGILHPEPAGRKLLSLPLSSDAPFEKLVEQLHQVPAERAATIDAMNERALVLAKELNASERPQYLPAEMQGVPMARLPLDGDEAFGALEVERARCLQDPLAEGHAAELAEKEAALRARAEELAMVAVQQQRAFLDAEPEGVALHHIPYEEDPCFQQLERERIHALGNNAEEVAPLEERMNLRLHELATEMKLADRAKLEPTVLGIPREDLYTDMDANEEFHQTEERYREAKTKDPESLPAIEEELNAQARGLAEHRHAEERAHLNQHPEGVPLAALPLNEDEPFLELEHAARMEVPPTSEEEVAQARQPLNQRAAELARESRLAYCDAAPEGIPLELLRLGERDDFVAKEQERRDLLASGALPEQVQEANTGLNSAAHDVARTMLHDRRGYLDPLPEGVPIEELPLNADEPFKTMEVERAITQLRGGEDADARVAALEQQLNERAHAVATKQKEEDLEGLEPRPYSIPLKWLNLHADEPFHAQLPPLREKKQMNVDGCNDAAIDEIHAALNARALELAKERSAVDRAFLDREPEGVPLEQLPLNEDAPFTNMEEERREAHKNNHAEAVAELEDRLQARAKELARNKLVEDRMYLNPSPDGMTLDELSVDDDESFHVMEAERAKLKSNPDENAEAIRELEEKLNERAKELAHKAKQRSRAFLRPTSSDIPVELLPLDGDADFVAMERQLRPLQREDAHCNAPMIDKLQEQMQARADELGEAALKSDRPSYLDAAPAGVPVADIPLDEDASYHGMEVERAIQKLKHPNDEAAESQAELEKQLNQRAHELAAQVRAEERALLDQEPEGIPLEDVPLDDDAKFRNMEEYCRKLRRDPAQNAAAVDETRLKLNDRSHELARGVVAEDLACLPWEVYRKAHKDAIGLHDYDRFREAANRRRRDRKRGADPVEMAAVEEEMNAIAKSIVDEDVDERRAFLDQKPEGMHVQDLPLDTDPIFSALEGDRSARALSREDNERKMNDRAHELAKEAFAERRRTFMDQEPEGVPLAALPLDVDGPFKESEIACYDLTYQKPSLTEAEQARVEELHAAMNARARELAKSEIMRDQAFLDPEPEGVPLEDLPLSSDATFAELMKERRALKQQGGKGCASAVAKKEAEINARTHELARAFLQEHRHYLNPEPQNVPIADVPLNGDDSFREKERELLAKTRDGATPEELAAMHAGLNERAEELAVQLLRKERAMQDQEPLGVPLEELPLNYDAHLNPMERERRALKKAPQRNMEDVRSVEGKIGQRTHAIAADYLTAERAFMDQQPEGVPLNCLNLSGDADFHGMEKQLRAEKHELPAGDATSPAVQATQARMNARAHVLASELLARERTFLNQAPLGIPLRELPLNEDEQFHHMEAQRRAMCEQRPLPEKELHRLEDTMKERVMELAREKQAADRAFLDQKPLGIPIEEVPLDEDRTFRAMETELRAMRQQPDADVATQEKEMNDRSKELARRLLADDRLYLDPKPLGVPIAELNVDEDEEFHAGELQRREMKKNTSQTPRMKEQLASMEESLNERAQQLAEDYLKKDRAYLDQEPEGVPLEEVGVDEDPEFVAMEEQRRKMRRTDPPATEGEMKAMEDRLNARAHDLARTRKGFQDEDFHAANADVAESWRRIGDLYPEGAYDPLVPSPTLPFDVCSGPKDMGYLAPFIAALARHTPLIARLFPDGAHPQNQPYRITLYDSNSAPVVVEIDDRIPCDATRESPKFSQSPDRLWYPLLLEKAYAKFVGGYEKINHCNAHDTLRDLTGRPVLHISLEDPKHAAAAHLGDFSAPAFWRSLAKDLRRGDVVVCVANATAPSGFHPLCSYALLDVVSLDSNATDGNSIVLKLHNSYVDEPSYTGRLHAEQDWTEEMKRACKYDPTEGNVMYVPLPTFLDNFACMQRCHINCGDRVSAPGEWNEFTAGGTPKFTTFRSNPIYLVENKSACPAPIMAELCHSGPLYVDEHGCERYPYTGIALLQTLDPKLPATPLLTNSTHQFLQKGMMLDSREVCSVMEIPASSTCYIVPYTKDRGTYGKFKLSVYPDVARVQLTPLRYAGLSLSPLTTEVVLPPMDEFGEGTRLDFLVSAATDVHILLRQASFVEGERRGDVLSEMSVAMSAFNEYGIKVGTTGEPSASREQALVFKAPQSGLYSLVASCAGSSTEPCKASVSVFVPVGVSVDYVPIQPDARQLFLQAQQPRFPTLPRTMTMTSSSRANSRERPLSGERRSSAAMRRADSASGRVQRSTSARQRRGSVGERSPALNRTSSRTRR